ncbi:hypothetical protein BCT04_15030 [Vibrio breoganii]|nr:hypothetical protein BCV00_05240 [Vibrio breoganii]PMG96399.1 hypothetical protein BCU79_07555 [Vibrio breoganii]PML13407.1 hypothetical protein BCT84_13425 [Vibrio breoganii]PMM11334.1 hypothetical protein BCT61_07280 [Vibrio breoganii]PMO63821.1 hypothetical protein BCT04_15030 [Vibrio breoganii]
MLKIHASVADRKEMNENILLNDITWPNFFLLITPPKTELVETTMVSDDKFIVSISSRFNLNK